MRRLALLVLLATACGGDDGNDELTCALLADPNNCWASAAATARACLPPAPVEGVLSADRRGCTFPDGSLAVFDDPLPSSTTELTRLALSLEAADGTICARFVDTFANRLELTAGGVTIVSELHPNRTYHLHCPDTTYEATFDTLFTCPPTPVPTDGFSVEPGLVTFTIAAITTPGELFRCVSPTAAR